MPQLLILDDHPLYREGVIVALQAPPLGAEVFGAGSVDEVLALLDRHPQIDLVLVDRWLGTEDGLEAVGIIARSYPAVSRVIVSGDTTVAAIDACRSALLQGFLPKSLSRDALVSAISTVLDGGVYWPDATGGDATQGAGAALTDRQREVLALLAHGHSNAEIALALGIAERTAKAHMAGIFDALAVDSRVMALVRARALGLVH